MLILVFTGVHCAMSRAQNMCILAEGIWVQGLRHPLLGSVNKTLQITSL